MRKIWGLVLAVGMIGLSGCEAEVDTYDAPTATISSNYSASYDEASGTAQYSAYFIDNTDSNSVVLSGNSDIQIDGQSLNQQIDSSGNASYFVSFPSSFSQTHEFYFRDDNGDEFTNNFFFPSLVEAVNGQSEYASLSEGYSVSWYATGPIAYGDTVKIILHGVNGSVVKHTDVSGYMNGTTYFSSGELAQLGNPISLQFCHSQQSNSIEAEDGGSLSLRSCSHSYSVVLGQ